MAEEQWLLPKTLIRRGFKGVYEQMAAWEAEQRVMRRAMLVKSVKSTKAGKSSECECAFRLPLECSSSRPLRVQPLTRCAAAPKPRLIDILELVKTRKQSRACGIMTRYRVTYTEPGSRVVQQMLAERCPLNTKFGKAAVDAKVAEWRESKVVDQEAVKKGECAALRLHGCARRFSVSRVGDVAWRRSPAGGRLVQLKGRAAAVGACGMLHAGCTMPGTRSVCGEVHSRFGMPVRDAVPLPWS
jgi:hypothetical protein